MTQAPPKQPKMVLSEKTTRDVGADYLTKWYCEPPARHLDFCVIREAWCHGGTVRKIFEIRIVEHRRPVDVHDG